MKKVTQIVTSIFVVALMTSSIPITQAFDPSTVLQSAVETLTEPKSAQAAPAAPANIAVEVIDNDNNTPSCSGGQYGTKTLIFPQSPGGASVDVTDAPSSKDINCAAITVDAGPILTPVPTNQSMYNLDFRMGIEAWEATDGSTVCNDNSPPHGTTGWTRWASEGEGQSLGTSFLNGEEVDCIRVFAETRALPAGTYIKDVKMGIGTGSQTRWTPWFSSGQFLTTGYAGSGDTNSVRIGLETDLDYKLDADHISDNVPRTAGSFTVGDTGNYIVDMKNIGGPWFSDQDISSSIVTCSNPESDDVDTSCQQSNLASCDAWQPQDIDDTCIDNRIVSSERFKLKRIDSNSAAVTTPNYLKYKRSVQYKWSAYEEMTEVCVPDPNGVVDPNEPVTYQPSFLEKIGIVKTVSAAQGGPGQICNYEPTGNIIASGPVTNQSRDVYLNSVANFDLPITPLQNGSWELLFQMERDGVELFGNPEHSQPPLTIVHITIIVGNVNPWQFTCTATQTVSQGTNANYDLSATVPNGYTNSIAVTMDPSNPLGATMQNAPLMLSPSNIPIPYRGTGIVPTGNLSPGNYILYFRATEGVNVAICQAQLVITPSWIGVYLKFNMSDGPVTLPSNATSGELSWETELATSCTASMVSGNVPAWSGNKPVANWYDGGRKFETITGLQPNSSYEFKLTCVNQYNNSASDTVVVTTAASPITPASVELFCMGLGDSIPHDGPCSVPSDSAAYISWQTSNVTNGCTLLPDFGPVDPNDTDSHSTGLLTTPPSSKTYVITCRGPVGTPDAVDSVTINIASGETPQTPILTASNQVCGVITLTWVSPPSATTTFRVFHSTVGLNGPWTEITDSDPRPLPVGTSSFIHDNTKTPPPSATNNYYKVVAYDGTTPSVDDPNKNITGPISLNTCKSNMSLSDKDLMSVGTILDPDSVYRNSASRPCNSKHDIIPEPKIFKNGDAVTYRINICNNGDTDFTNVEVLDTMQGLAIVPNSFQYTNLPDGTTCKRAPEQLNLNGDSSKFRLFLNNIRKPDLTVVPPESLISCSVTFQAIAKASGTLSGLYNFRNTALASADGPVGAKLLGPYYKFSLGSDAIDREEIPPLQN